MQEHKSTGSKQKKEIKAKSFTMSVATEHHIPNMKLLQAAEELIKSKEVRNLGSNELYFLQMRQKKERKK